MFGRMAAELGEAMQVGRGHDGTMGRPETDLDDEEEEEDAVLGEVTCTPQTVCAQ